MVCAMQQIFRIPDAPRPPGAPSPFDLPGASSFGLPQASRGIILGRTNREERDRTEPSAPGLCRVAAGPAPGARRPAFTWPLLVVFCIVLLVLILPPTVVLLDISLRAAQPNGAHGGPSINEAGDMRPSGEVE
jgi:hypothetical protein